MIKKTLVLLVIISILTPVTLAQNIFDIEIAKADRSDNKGNVWIEKRDEKKNNNKSNIWIEKRENIWAINKEKAKDKSKNKKEIENKVDIRFSKLVEKNIEYINKFEDNLNTIIVNLSNTSYDTEVLESYKVELETVKTGISELEKQDIKTISKKTKKYRNNTKNILNNLRQELENIKNNLK